MNTFAPASFPAAPWGLRPQTPGVYRIGAKGERPESKEAAPQLSLRRGPGVSPLAPPTAPVALQQSRILPTTWALIPELPASVQIILAHPGKLQATSTTTKERKTAEDLGKNIT